MKAFCEFFFCCLAYGNDLACEMQGLSGHPVVEVHLYCLRCDLEHYSRYDTAHAVEHRDGVTGYEKVFAYFTVHLKCRFRQVENA